LLVERLWSITGAVLTIDDRRTFATLLLDHLAVAGGGAHTKSAIALREVLESSGASTLPMVPIVGTNGSLPPLEAAMANAVSGHSLEMDDTHSASSLHPGVVVFPTALSCTVLADADAEAFFLGIVRGYEAMCRIGRAAGPSNLYLRHLHPTSVVGHFGAAVTAGSIMGLDETEAVAALGVVATLASGTMQFLEDGSWTKHLNPGNAARNGILAVLLAKRGFRAPHDALGGPAGFLTIVGRGGDAQALDQAGTPPLELGATGIKPHSCCRYNQAAIDATIALRNRGVRAQDVVSIHVGLLSVATDIVWQPVESKRHPTSVTEAQFSLPYCIAVALTEGVVGPSQFTDERMRDPTLLDLMQRVECIADPKLDAAYPERWPAWVRVTNRAGSSLQQDEPCPRGDPDNKMSEVELLTKLEMLTSEVWTSAERNELRAAVDGSANGGSVRRLLVATNRHGAIYQV
jgi:2-methylcitrate dehydratase PrpD